MTLHVRPQASLKPFNSFGIDVRAQLFAEAHSDDDVREALAFAATRSLPLLVIGGGSNLRNLKALQSTQGKAELDLFLRRYEGEVDEVPDPYYEGEQGFERVLDLIERACDLLVIELKGRL